jgi:hypothetical protein
VTGSAIFRGGKVAVHCHAVSGRDLGAPAPWVLISSPCLLQGFGRTGLVIACTMMLTEGVSADEAVARVRSRRPRSIQTKQQASTGTGRDVRSNTSSTHIFPRCVAGDVCPRLPRAARRAVGRIPGAAAVLPPSGRRSGPGVPGHIPARRRGAEHAMGPEAGLPRCHRPAEDGIHCPAGRRCRHGALLVLYSKRLRPQTPHGRNESL